MKKILILMLALVLCLSVFAACTPEPAETEGLDKAYSYVKDMYKAYLGSEPTEKTGDFELISTLKFGEDTYTVEWTSNNEAVKVVPGEGVVTIDFDETTKVDILYTITGVVKNAGGAASEPIVLNFKVPAQNFITIPEALAAEDGTLVTVKGTVTFINTAWDDGYKNISVTISDDDGNKLYLYRLATKVELGDIITVTGEMATYNNARQIAQGATAVINGHTDVTVTYNKISLTEALTTKNGTLVEVEGTVKSIDKEWDEGYKNMSITITDGNGNDLYVYRLPLKVAVGDYLVIKGELTSYNGNKQIAQGATATKTEHTHTYNTLPAKCDICGAVKADHTECVDADGNIICDACGAKIAGPVTQAPQVVETAPVAGTAYKFSMYQSNKKVTLYLTGEMQSYYLATTEDMTEAMDFYVEVVEGGYRLYYNKGDEKVYLSVVKSADGEHDNGVYNAETPSVWTWSEDLKTLITSIGEETFYLGTYDNYTTMGPSTIDKAETSYVGQLTILVDLDSISDADKVAAEKDALNVSTTITTELALPSAGTTYADVEITWTAEGASATIADGKLTAIQTSEEQTIKLTATIKSGDVSETKEFTVTVKAENTTGGTLIADIITLEDGTPVVISGTVTDIGEAWTEQYNNMSVTITDSQGNSIYVFRMTTKVNLGDEITVTGEMATYKESRQIGQNATAVVDKAHTECTDANKDCVCDVCNAKVNCVDADGNGTCDVCGNEMKTIGATIVFDSTDKRTTQNANQQVWESNGIKFINDKDASQTDVADYSAPVRCYKSSKITIEYTGMVAIDVECYNASYAQALADAVGAAASVDGKVVTITLDAPANSYTASLTVGQVRINSITVYVG